MSKKTSAYSAPDIECDGCANAIKKALGKIEGIGDVSVDIPAKTVTVTHEEAVAPPTVIIGTLDKAGFPATAINAAAGAV